MFNSRSDTLKAIVLTLAVIALGVGVNVYAYAASPARTAASCGPVQGSIAVQDDAPNKADLARVSGDDARAAVLAQFATATITEVDLEEEDGFLVYEVDYVVDGQEHEAYVDAGNGTVLCQERE